MTLRLTRPLPSVLLTAALAGQAPAKPAPAADLPDLIGQRRLEALRAEAQAVIAAWREARAAAERTGAGVEPVPARPSLSPLVPRYAAAAAEFAGAEAAVPFLVWLVKAAGPSDPAAARAAVDTLAAAHAASPRLIELGPMLPFLSRVVGVGEEPAQRLLRAIETGSRDPDVLGWATLARFEPILAEAKPGSHAHALAVARLRQRSEQVRDARLRERLGELVAAHDRAAVGRVAPDIVGVDLDGGALRLADHRGKVVLLDFWGDW